MGRLRVPAPGSRSGGVADPDATNETATVALQVNAPDLAVTSVAAPATAATMQSMPVSFTVANPGPGTAPASNVQLMFVANTTTPAHRPETWARWPFPRSRRT